MSLTLADFEDADRAILRRLRQELRDVLGMLRPEGGPVDAKPLRRRAETEGWRSLMQAMKVFGVATYERRPGPEVQKVMHDLKGGSLAVLLLRIQSAGDVFDTAEAERLRRLARDHINLMRTCIADIETA